MNKLIVSMFVMLSASLQASHHSLSLEKGAEFAQKRIELLKSQRNALLLLKQDTKAIDSEIAVAENSLKAVHTRS